MTARVTLALLAVSAAAALAVAVRLGPHMQPHKCKEAEQTITAGGLNVASSCVPSRQPVDIDDLSEPPEQPE